MTDPLPAATLDELLDHAAWVRRLARSLVANPDDAEDLAQEAMARALERRPKQSMGALSAWLGGMVRNLRRERIRGEARRRAREGRFAPEDSGLPTPAELAERVELQRTLAAAVLALPEPYRDVVLLHFYEEMPLRTIGQRRQVPMKTVESQLRRGLEHLRAALDRSCDGRRSWVHALAPLAGTASVAATAANVLVTSMKLKLALGGVAAVCLGLAAWLARPQQASDRMQDAGGALAATSLDPGNALLEAVVAPAGTEARNDVAWAERAEPSRELRVRVIDEMSGVPISGYAVSLIWLTGASDEAFGEPVELMTDQDGWTVIAVPKELPLKQESCHARICGEDSDTHKGLRTTVIGSSRPSAEFTLELEPFLGAAFGTVVDLDGRRVPFARVLLHHLEEAQDTLHPNRVVTADASGSFRIEGLTTAGDGFTLAAEAPGYAAARRATVGSASDREYGPFELRVAPAHPLRGIVVDEQGAAIPGAEVVLWPCRDRGEPTEAPPMGRYLGFPQHAFQTDADGRFELAWILPLVYCAGVRHPQYAEGGGHLEPGQEYVRLVLEQPAACSGVVVDATGQALEGVHVEVDGYPMDVILTTDAQGRFTCPAVQTGQEARLILRKTGYAMRVEGPMTLLAESALRIQLEPESPLAGRVVDAEGKPMRGVRLDVRGTRRAAAVHRADILEPWEEIGSVSETMTDLEGRFRFESLYPGSYTLTASGDARLAVLEVEAPSEDLEIVAGAGLDRTATLLGQVLDEATGRPIPEFWVRWEGRDEADRRLQDDNLSQSVRNAEGRFRVPGVPLRRGVLHFWARGYSFYASAIQTFTAGEHEMGVVLSPARGLRLRLLKDTGVPFPEVEVRVVGSEGQYQPMHRDTGSGWAWENRSDEAGRVDVYGLPSSHDVTLEFHLLREDRRVRLPLSRFQDREEVQDLAVP